MRITKLLFNRIREFKEAKRINLSFSGCGFLGAYNFGAAYCLFTESKNLISRVDRFSGASAGSLVAALCALTPEKIDSAIEALYSIGDEVHSLPLGAMTPGYYISESLLKHMINFLPEDVSPAQNKLFVSVTKLNPVNNVLINNFDDRNHLMDDLLL
ncbi:unnamed protein product [Caenorhabditis bovis]|uniref:PNPLA domain-containing protein n=1 Tax=Caenorhabditis bovis TaxID=2654633 RepID=A0A8S1E272_9PELO|nr:unnamed protein product [Caenorhabditis bovis]